jgi:hypothetical protein
LIAEDHIGITSQGQKLTDFGTEILRRQDRPELFAPGVKLPPPRGGSISGMHLPKRNMTNSEHRAGRGMMRLRRDLHLMPPCMQTRGDREDGEYVAKASFGYNEDSRHTPSFCFFIPISHPATVHYTMKLYTAHGSATNIPAGSEPSWK